MKASVDECGYACRRAKAYCLCGTNVGRYECACDAGYYLFASHCVREFSFYSHLRVTFLPIVYRYSKLPYCNNLILALYTFIWSI